MGWKLKLGSKLGCVVSFGGRGEIGEVEDYGGPGEDPEHAVGYYAASDV